LQQSLWQNGRDVTTDSKAYRIASNNLYSRNFEGDEVLIVDTEIGLYFSLRGCAVDIWSLIESGANLGEIVAELGRRYDCMPEEALAVTHTCLKDLLSNDLVRETEARIEQTSMPAWNEPKQPLPAPLIERFTDMKDLLLLDPIHDVSDMGWPRRASDPPGDPSS
jgi:hypothetical protein